MSGFRKRPRSGLLVPMALKGWVYRRGFRPKPGNPLYSPSIDIQLQARDALRDVLSGLRPHIEQAEARMYRDPTLRDRPDSPAAHKSDRYCHHYESGGNDRFTFSSMCGYPSVGVVDGVTACERHYRAAQG